MTVAAEESEDDLFEKLADEEDAAGGGSKVERAKAESLRARKAADEVQAASRALREEMGRKAP